MRILDDGIDAAVRLSHRYLPERQLPDKAVSVLDTACARLALGQSATPAAARGRQRRLEDVDVQMRVLEREEALGVDHAERLAELAARREAIQAELAGARGALGQGARRWSRRSADRAQLEASRRARKRTGRCGRGDHRAG